MKKFKVDLHLHTNASYDAVISFEDLKKAYQMGKFDAVAITDHGTIKNALDFANRNEFPVIIGQEVETKSGDVIGLFLQEEVPEEQEVLETCFAIHAQGGLVYIPHPFDPLKSGLREDVVLQILPVIDLFETHNFSYGAGIFKSNLKKVSDFARKHNLSSGAGSDAHIPSEIGMAFLEFENVGQEILKSPKAFWENCGKAIPAMIAKPNYKIALKHLTNFAYMRKSFLPNLHCLTHALFSRL
ncbi:MAG: PHP domain-containing protein [Candidatus Cloacimonetes bacterium]|nr:PHP domain-containing protein [Candidatus Cloacimonadota bacterium]